MLNRSSSNSWPVHLCSVWMKNLGFFWPRQVSIGNNLTNLIWLLKSKMLEVLVPDQIFSLKLVMKMTTRASPDKSKLSSRILRAHFQVIIRVHDIQLPILNLWILIFFLRNFLLILICSELVLLRISSAHFRVFFFNFCTNFSVFSCSPYQTTNSEFWIFSSGLEFFDCESK